VVGVMFATTLQIPRVGCPLAGSERPSQLREGAAIAGVTSKSLDKILREDLGLFMCYTRVLTGFGGE